jgi:cytochrome c peroxidase
MTLDADDDQLIVWSEFDHTLTFIPLAEAKRGADAASVAPVRVAIARKKEQSYELALGRRLFHAAGDPRISDDGRACASCHPDGRDDGLVWSSPDGPRRTMWLAGRVDRGPYGWRGDTATIPEHLAITIKNLAGQGIDDADKAALAAYIKSIAPPPAPHEADVARGRAIFTSSDAACASCHKEQSDFSDRESHDVRSRVTFDRFADFMTPTLRSVGARAPYFHDGRFATLSELIRKCDGEMGNTKQLSDGDVAALEAFLRSI